MSAHISRPNRPVAVIAVDVGNSKTDVALISVAGEVLGAVRGPTSSHQQVGAEAGMAVLVSLVERAVAEAAPRLPDLAFADPHPHPIAELVAYCAAGADFRSDVALLRRALRSTGLATDQIVENDCYGGLRAGTNRTWGVSVICGSGMNCLGVSPNGRVARFDALGDLSGDWGGGHDLGLAGLAAAVRAQDGRGTATLLARTVPAHFGLTRPRSLTAALYRGTIPEKRTLEIAPLLFEAAGCGDGVAAKIVEKLASEIVAWAVAAINRARLVRLDPDVVLAGGVFRAEYPPFYERIEEGIHRVAPAARITRLQAPPVVGAALLGLDRLLGAPIPPSVERRLRAELTGVRLARD